MHADVGQDVRVVGAEELGGEQGGAERLVVRLGGRGDAKGDGHVLHGLDVIGGFDDDFEVAARGDGAGHREAGDDGGGLAGEESSAGGEESLSTHGDNDGCVIGERFEFFEQVVCRRDLCCEAPGSCCR